MRNLLLTIRLHTSREGQWTKLLTTHSETKGGLLYSGLMRTLVILLGCVIASSASAERHYGEVVDEETGEPLEGAVVTVIWYRAPLVTWT
jgi:hypothetical protein